ncbi:MAG: DMT family transporter [Geovibrio sp.]|nr:DMT family transporter [Geovibrio sp.]
MKINYRNPHFLMLLYTVLVSGSFHIGHVLINYMDSTVLTFVRFLLGSVLFGIYVFPRYEVRLPSLSDLARYFAISASMIFYFWAMFEALRYTTPLNTAITYTVVPLFSAVYGIFLLKERVSLKKFTVLFAAMLGAVWVIIDGSLSRLAELDFNKGDIIFLIGCLCIGLYSPLSKKLHKTEPMPVLTLWTMITGTVWLLLIANVKILKINFLCAGHSLLCRCGVHHCFCHHRHFLHSAVFQQEAACEQGYELHIPHPRIRDNNTGSHRKGAAAHGGDTRCCGLGCCNLLFSALLSAGYLIPSCLLSLVKGFVRPFYEAVHAFARNVF